MKLLAGIDLGEQALAQISSQDARRDAADILSKAYGSHAPEVAEQRARSSQSVGNAEREAFWCNVHSLLTEEQEARSTAPVR